MSEEETIETTEAVVEETPAVVEEAPVEVVATKTTEVKAGQTVRIHERIKDVSPKGEVRERIQVFEGIVLGVKGAGVSRTLTIRKISAGGFGVERIYPVNSPIISKIELVKTAKVRRAKLSFLSKVAVPFKRKFKDTYAAEAATTKKKKK